MPEHNRSLKHIARQLRKEMTDAEQRLWSRIRRKQIHGVQFYRQRPVGPYIVDFYAPKVLLVLEVDGSQHLEATHRKQDREREEFFKKRGLHVLRFDNLQVLGKTDDVVEEIWRMVGDRLGESPLPPFEKGG